MYRVLISPVIDDCPCPLLPVNVHCCLPTSTAACNVRRCPPVPAVACQRPLLPAGARCCLLMSPTPAIACWKNRRDGGGAPCLELSGDGVAVAGEVPRHSWVQPVTNIANINVIYSDFTKLSSHYGHVMLTNTPDDMGQLGWSHTKCLDFWGLNLNNNNQF